MEYFLAIDKGEFETKERFTKLSLKSIDKRRGKASLEKPNNLKNIATFTMSFNNSQELKSFLISMNILPKIYQYYDVVIAYEEPYSKKIRFLEVAYKCYEKYFDINNLSKLIAQRIKKNPEFLFQFLNYFPPYYSKKAYYALKKTPLRIKELTTKVKDFLESLSYSFVEPEEPSFLGLYLAAILLANYDNIKSKILPFNPNISPQALKVEEPILQTKLF